jgi:tRNA nucleotidyltransferase (CCA-adding enzyme)
MSAPTPVLRTARSEVQPTEEEQRRLRRLSAKLQSATAKAAARYKETRSVVVGGSYAKGTWLPGEADLDIFVKFSTDTDERRFEEVGLKIGEQATAGYPRGKKFAQHPYTEATVEGVKVNIVPCYDVPRGHWKSAADRSPFHVDIVKGLPYEKKTEIRLLKKFMRATGVYGAEIETQGFSGYVAEVLVMKHSDFLGALRAFANISPAPDGPVFRLPDPVDESRDLARAVSPEKLGRVILAAREFLRRPSPSFFGRMMGKRHEPLRKEVLAVAFSHSRMSEDMLWGELKKTLRHLVAHLEAEGFGIARWLAVSDDQSSSAFLLIPIFASLPPLVHRVGPEVVRGRETEDFLSKNRAKSKLTWVGEDGRVHILQGREHTAVLGFLREVTRSGLAAMGASQEVASGISKSGRVLEKAALRRYASTREWLRKGIIEIVSDTVGAHPA